MSELNDLHEKIREYEDENLISMLTPEAIDALMTGRRFMEEQQKIKKDKEAKALKKKRIIIGTTISVGIILFLIALIFTLSRN